jgi:hypothetical protein
LLNDKDENVTAAFKEALKQYVPTIPYKVIGTTSKLYPDQNLPLGYTDDETPSLWTEDYLVFPLY